MARQLQCVVALGCGAEIVVACPGRLLDHVNDGSIDLSRVEVLVLDEATSAVDAETESRFARCADRYGPATVVIGDSHGMNIYNVLAKTEAFEFLLGLAIHSHQAHKPYAKNWYRNQVTPFVERNEEHIQKLIYHLWNFRLNKTEN